MKTQKKLLKVILMISLMFSLQGCLDIFITTEIKPNGQIEQTIVLEGDSTSILDSYIPAVSNTTWNSEWVKVEDDKHKLILSKTFKNYKEFNTDMNPSDSLPAVRVKAELTKKFRWFFTYLDYNETLLPSNPFTQLDWKDYLSTDEVELIAMDEEEREKDPRFNDVLYDQAEKKFENYIFRSAYEDFFVLFTKAASETALANFNLEELKNKQEEIYQYAYNETDFSDLEDLLEAFKAILGEDIVLSITTSQSELIGIFEKKLGFFNECMDDNYHFSIKMPGLLVETNSNIIESSRLSWDVDFFDFYFKGLEMKSQSRIVNTWAFIIASVIVLLLLIGLAWNLLKHRKTNNE
jgi:hypothetical protein